MSLPPDTPSPSFNTLCKQLGFTRNSPMHAALASPLTWQQSEWNAYYVRAAIIGRRPVADEWMRWTAFMQAAVGSLVCLHCRAEAEDWMQQHPPEAYLNKPWPALQYVTDMQNNINDRLGLQTKSPTDVLKRLADLTRHPPHTPTAATAIKSPAAAAPPGDTSRSNVLSAAAASALTAAFMRGFHLLRRR